MKIAVVSGGFDPIHSGHIDYIFEAKENADYLIVALNSDHWLSQKKGKPFMEFSERKQILESIKYVDEVIEFDDTGNFKDAKYLDESRQKEIIFNK